MPVVGMPDGTQVQFPDEMPPEQIKGLIAQKFPQAVQQLQAPTAPTQPSAPNYGEAITSGLHNAATVANFLNPASAYNIGKKVVGLLPGAPKQEGPGLTERLAETAKGYGSVLGNVAQTIKSGVTLPHDVYAGNVNLESPEGTQRVIDLASLATPINPAYRAGSRFGAPPVREKVVAPAPTPTDLRVAKNVDYKLFQESPGVYSPEIKNALADQIEAKLKSQNAFEHRTQDLYPTISLLRGEKPSGMAEMQSYLSDLRDIATADESTRNTRRAARIAIKEFTDFLGRTEPEAAQTLARADANNAALQRVKEVSQAADIAGLRTKRAGYGGNDINNVRQVLSPFVERAIKENPHGFKPDEIQAFRDIVEGKGGVGVLRQVGAMAPSKGGIQTALAIGSMGITAGAGALANKLGAFLTRRQVDQLVEKLAKRSPAYEEAVSNATNRYSTALDDFTSAPSAAKLAALIGASRSLANGLTRDGISITSGDLVRRIQGPVHGGAEEEQTKP